MTNPNNGASLEDCHSNFFALTDLCGIKWRRLISDGYPESSSGHHAQQHHQHQQPHGPLDDPVLSSYARCLASDILCVWRRSPNAKQQHQSDLFHLQTGTTTPTQTSPHFMHQQGSNQQTQSQLGMQSHHNMQMMSTHLMGTGSHGMSGGPPPYPASGQTHSHQVPGQGFSASLSPMSSSHSQQSLFNSLTSNSSSNGSSLSGPKELWIFWYGEEPELSSLVHSQLLKPDAEQGSWENGLSYECRTLLFKALHNLIERCLLARDFVRVGKWFIPPSEDPVKPGGAPGTLGGAFYATSAGNSSNSNNSNCGVGAGGGTHGTTHNRNSNNNSSSSSNNVPMQLSFSFSFFVHGESTVCMSVDVRQHPSVRRVSKQHLHACQSPKQTVPVILAPYGLAGTLTGVGYRMSDPGTNKILEEWKQFYPVEAAIKSPVYDVSTSNSNSTHGPHSSPHSSTNGNGGSSSQQQSSPGMTQGASASSSTGIPPVLEVIVGGVRMRYPSCYVLCTELDDLFRSLESNNSTNAATPAAAPATLKNKQAAGKSMTAACPAPKSPGRPQGSLTFPQKVDKVEGLLPERVWQETILPSHKLKNQTDHPTSASSSEQAPPPLANSCGSAGGQWDFIDPAKNLGCCCSKCKRPSGSKGMMGSQSTKSGTKVKKSTFHKRSLQQLTQIESWATHWSLSEEQANLPTNSATTMVNGSIKVENQQSTNRVNNSETPVGGPPSYKGGSSTATGIGSEGPGASPASVAPSPLATPRSQPSSVSQPEPPMPTLSPQPNSSEKPPVQTPDNTGPKSVSSLSNQVFSPIVSFDGAKAEQGMEQGGSAGNDAPKLEAAVYNGNNVSGTAVIPNSISVPRELGLKSLKRPVLPGKEYEPLLAEESVNQPSEMLYDYTAMEAWLNHPVKRMKSAEGNSLASMYSWGWGLRKNPDTGNEDRSHCRKRKADPYEFDDEHHHNPGSNLDGFKRNGIKEEDKGAFGQGDCGNSKVVAGNLFTNEGLQPSFRDLDQIFDNSDTSSDETFQVPTPPGSNKPANLLEDSITSITCNSSGPKSKSGLSILRPEELSKMFPTPPSQPEHNPIASPCGLQSDNPSMEGLNDSSICIRRGQDSYPVLGSPPDDGVELRLDNGLFMKSGAQQSLRMHYQDWSYVFKPATIYKMLGSSKYSPLSMLPSQKEPALPLSGSVLVYKGNWPNSPQPATTTPSQQTTNNTTSTSQVQHLQHPTTPNVPNPAHLRPGLSPISPVPTSIRGAPFDMGSPPSSNMYLKQGPHGPSTHNSMPNHPGNHHMYGSRGPEAHALVVNLSLSDSVIGLFRDHNFDSCTMCVCNANNKIIGNIRGSEVGTYVQDTSPDEEAVRCNCGFSASANRRLAHRSGLFYEDEYEITTSTLAPLALPSDEWYERKKQSLLLLDPKYTNAIALNIDRDLSAASNIVDSVPPFLLEMLKEQCLLLFGASTASRFTGEVVNSGWSDWQINYLENLDANRAALIALEHGRTIMVEASGRSGYSRLPEDMIPIKNTGNLLHRWQFLWVRGPKSSQDIMQVMKALHPLLQDAVHAKAWDAQYTVSGPLTWRMFHRLAGRGTDDRCEPQPIPSILVGSEKDWLSLSPLAIRFWEKLLLEPYAYPRDVAYMVVCPDSDVIIHRVKTFFREFSSMYEVCQLGKHSPVTKILPDGIVRVGKTAASRLASEPLEEWFSLLPDIPVASVLKLYAKVCKHFLARKLSTISLDQSLFDASQPNNHASQSRMYSQDRSAPSPKMPPPSGDPGMMNQGPPTPKPEYEAEPPKECQPQESPDDEERDPPALVVYFIEPCGFRSDSEDLHRMVSLGLLRCFSSMLTGLPDNIKNNITLQVISLEDLLNLGNSTLETRLKNDQMRAMALTVYSQCRRLLVHQNNVKSLTGFGPAAAAELFIKSKDEKKKGSYRLYTPPYILAPTKEKVSEGVEWLNGLQGHTVGGMVSSGNALASGNPSPPSASSVLYVAYCLSEDQRWLLASATDERGELLETTTISIYVPNRSKRRKASARKHGLQKLMDFILGVMSTGVQPWRLVVGRLGRIGHGELESWSTLLSRKSLLRASNQLKIACHQCSLQYPADTPCVLSACLVSLEPDSCLRLMPDLFTPDERFAASGTTSALSTPQDVSCTHILVFPTSATTQSSQTAFQEQHINGPDLGDEDLLFINVQEDMSDGIDGMQDLQLGDIFSWADTGPGAPSPVGSPRRDSASQPGSPGIGASGRQSPFQSGGQGRNGGRGDAGEELGTLLQQPLALGYFVSTAPSGKLPNWFWSSCPHRSVERGAAVFLKSALHLHSHNILHNIDDPLLQQSNAKQHPLDSQFTTDVLRFVLEGYNALSWLCLDPVTHDRKSCLPVHIQKLLQLYYTITTLV